MIILSSDYDKDRYHRCRWCRFFDDGKCYHGEIGNSISDMEVYKVAESGKLAEVLKEAIGSCKPKIALKHIEEMLKSYKVSDKRIQELKDCWSSMIEIWIEGDLIPSIDNDVSFLYINSVNEVEGLPVEIHNPEEFYCRYFD